MSEYTGYAENTISENRYLNLQEMAINAQFIMSYFFEKGWTKNAIAAMLGNMQVESTINPGLWQGMDEFDYSGGFGLVQWTPATKYIDWATVSGFQNYADWRLIIPQCLRIDYELENDLQWESTIMTFYEFTQSTENVRYLSDRFCWGYERPANPDLEGRADNAEYWFGLLEYIGFGGKVVKSNWLFMLGTPRIF